MFEWILLAIGIAGFGLAGYLDLRYTEFPDWLPYSIIILALVARGVFAFLSGDWWILISSLFIGGLFLGFGLALYFLKQWGDGDAWLLGCLGFLFPEPSGFAVESTLPFPLMLLFNFFFISLAYLIVYALILGVRKPKVNKMFLKSLKSESKMLIPLITFFFALCWGIAVYFYYFLSIPLPVLTPTFLLPIFLTLMIFLVHYGKIIEKHVFKKKIKAKQLKVGDVLVSDKWRGLNEKEVKKLKKIGKDVWIKEGVRFAPVFIITLLITLFYGSLLMLFL
jgi:hypothetical protein